MKKILIVIAVLACVASWAQEGEEVSSARMPVILVPDCECDCYVPEDCHLVVSQLASDWVPTATRTWEDHENERFYIIEYLVPSREFALVPATMDGQPHYPARIRVFEILRGQKRLVGKEFGGEYVDKGCFEDAPDAMVRAAIKLATPIDTDLTISIDTGTDELAAPEVLEDDIQKD
jgi:hypothetical protein